MRNFIQKRAFPLLLMAAILLGGSGWAAAVSEPDEFAPGRQGAAAAQEEPAVFTEAAETGQKETAAPFAGVTLDRTRHAAYLSGSGDALPFFRPSGQLTRAQTAQMFYLLLDGAAPQDVSFADVPDNAWYAPAARAMGSLGVMRAGEAAFLPDEPLTRAEFTRCLACFFPLRTDGGLFPDVPEGHPAAEAICSARAWGWVQGDDDGNFRPDDLVTRVEAVVMLNRALGRTPDRAYIDYARPAFYVDVSPESWYYYEIVEAAASHEYAASGSGERWRSHLRASDEPETGFSVIDGEIYYYDRRQGDVLRGETLEMFRFDAQGRLVAESARLRRKALELVQASAGTPLDPSGLSALLAEAVQAAPEWSLLLINRDNPLPEGFTVPEFSVLEGGYRIDSRVAPALEQFLAGARAAGFRPLVCSAYRTREKQTELFERRVRSLTSRGRSRADAEAAASFWIARPGTSEHQAGLAADIIDSGYQVLNKSQENRPVQQWLMAHCAEYGFILRYPTDRSGLTGVGYEPWHYRYVGVEAAQEIMSRGICLEEYLEW